MENSLNDRIIELTADIVSSYVGCNTVSSQEIPELIAAVKAALDQAASGTVKAEEAPLVPAVPIKKSITPDYLISLEDGKKFKSLKRHLRTSYDMSPEQYRARWGLPHDYPMVAPNYASSRSEMARAMGLGRKAPAQVAKAKPTRKSPPATRRKRAA